MKAAGISTNISTDTTNSGNFTDSVLLLTLVGTKVCFLNLRYKYSPPSLFMPHLGSWANDPRSAVETTSQSGV
jgi:hypothetical protein